MKLLKLLTIPLVLGSTILLEAQNSGDLEGQQRGAFYTGQILGGKPGQDSISVRYEKSLIVDYNPKEFYIHPDKDGTFSFHLSPTNGLGKVVFRLEGTNRTSLSPSPAYYHYYVENNDSIFLEIKIPKAGKITHSFSGKGADKYWAIQSVFGNIPMVRDYISKDYYEDKTKARLHIDKIIKRCELQVNTMRGILDFYKEQLPLNIYNLLEADIVARGYRNLMGQVLMYRLYERYDLMNETFLNHIKELNFPDEILASSEYPRVIISKTVLQAQIKRHSKNYNTSDIYELLKTRPNSLFKDKLITEYLYQQYYRQTQEQIPEKESENTSLLSPNEMILRDAILNQIQHPGLKEVLSIDFERYKIGTDAYNFALPDINGNIINLSDFKGKVVFIDVYSPGCTGCVKLAKRLKETIIPEFKSNPNVEFIAISLYPDKEKSVQDLQESDKNASINQQVCLWAGSKKNRFAEYYRIRLFPTIFLIDEKGKIYNSSNDGLTLSRSDEDIINMIYEALEKYN